MSKKNLRDVWLVESSPADVLRSDMVSVSSKATLATMELFFESIGFGYEATFRAGTTRVVRVNKDHGNSCNLGFILDKVLELIEPPRMDRSSLAAAFNRYPQSDSPEPFEG